MAEMFTQKLGEYGGAQPVVEFPHVEPAEETPLFADIFAAANPQLAHRRSRFQEAAPEQAAAAPEQAARVDQEFPKWVYPEPRDPEDHAKGGVLVKNREEEREARLRLQMAPEERFRTYDAASSSSLKIGDTIHLKTPARFSGKRRRGLAFDFNARGPI